MNRKGRRVLVSFFLCLLSVLLCSCKAEVASEREIKEYAKKHFGQATFLKSEESDDRTRVCYFTDKEYGFDYSVRSEVMDVGLDGSKFWESEGKNSDFEDLYYVVLQDKTKEKLAKDISSETNAELFKIEIDEEKNYFTPILLLELTCENLSMEVQNAANSFAKKYLETFREFDTRGFYEDACCIVYGPDSKKLLTFDYAHATDGITPENQAIDEYTVMAKYLNQKAVYVRKEQKLFRDTGVALDQLIHVLGVDDLTEESPVLYYYFTADNKEFFIADFTVRDDETGSYKRYSNYETVFPKTK